MPQDPCNIKNAEHIYGIIFSDASGNGCFLLAWAAKNACQWLAISHPISPEAGDLYSFPNNR
eukprot:scaffold331821_cov44-Prasinocladus_malaysianus.AAC.2